MLGTALAFAVAELGDKTMLATIALAGTQPSLPTWIGVSLGMTLASGLAIAVVSLVGPRLPHRTLRLAGAGAFFVFGALLLVDGLRA